MQVEGKGFQTVLDSKTELIREMQEELFLKRGQGWFRIVSGSMQPLIDVHDKVLAVKTNPAEVKPGHIILFKNSGALVTHRVVKRIYENGNLFLLQRGDREGLAGMIKAESVLGKIVALEKDGEILRLDQGRGRIIDTLLGLKNCAGYEVSTKVDVFKKRLKDKRGFPYLKFFYRALKWPFSFLNKAIVHIVRIVRMV